MPPPGTTGTRLVSSERRAISTPGVPGPPMNLCGDRKIASLCASAWLQHVGDHSMSTYGPAAAKSQNDSAPYRCSVSAIAQVFEMMPVTLLAAEKEPILSGRLSCTCSCCSSSARSMCPSQSSPITTTSAIDSRQGSSFEWCSNGPMNTTGRSSGGMCALRP